MLFFGEQGTEKTNCASLVHFGSNERRQPMVLFDCSRFDKQAVVVFGRGEKAGLLERVSQGTLLLTNVHRVSCQQSL